MGMNKGIWDLAERALTSSLISEPEDLVQRFGRTPQAIVTKRHMLGIPRYITKGEPRPWSTEDEALLGTDSDNVIAGRLKRTTVSVSKRRRFRGIPHYEDREWSQQDDALLGTSTDRQVAEELGRSTRHVRERRRKQGILPFIYTPRLWTLKEERIQIGRAHV